MIGRLFLITLILTHFKLKTSSAKDVTLNCVMKDQEKLWDKQEPFIVCELQNDLNADSVAKEAIAEGTIDTKTSKVFSVKDKKLLVIPKGLETTFPNLQGLFIDKTKLKVLENELLQKLSKLKYLTVTNSGLTVLASGSFADNIDLEWIDLSGNLITYIDSTAFDGPTGLNNLNLDKITCLADATTTSADTIAKVKTLKAAVGRSCADAEKLPNVLITSLRDNEILKDSSEICTADLTEAKTKFNSQLDEIQKCEKDNSDLNEQIIDLNSQLEEKGSCGPADSNVCSFKENGANGYTCVAKGLSIKATKDQAVKWTGTHTAGNNNDRVLTLTIQSQTAELLPSNIGATFGGLKNLIVKNSKLIAINRGELSKLARLEKLEIVGNDIKTIGSGVFDELTGLITLDLSKNNIVTLPFNAFGKLLKLNILKLSDNKLTMLRPDWIDSGNKIQEFYLNNNAVKPIDRVFIWRLQNAKIIDLAGTGCAFSLNKVTNPQSKFTEFFKEVYGKCSSAV